MKQHVSHPLPLPVRKANIPSCQAASPPIPVRNERCEQERQHGNKEPEEEAVAPQAWTAMRRSAVESLAALARRDWDLAVRGTFVPVLLVISTAGIVVRQRLQALNEYTVAGFISSVVEFAV